MLKYIRHIPIEDSDLNRKRKIVKEIEEYGFECRFVPNGVDVYAREYTLLTYLDRNIDIVLLVIIGVATVLMMLVG